VREKVHAARADSLRKLADDSTCHAPCLTAHDSSEHWHRLYVYAYDEANELRAALDTADARADTAEADRKRWQAIAEGSDRINAQLRKDLEHSEPRCRLLPLVPCPSRKAVAIGGVALGLFAPRLVQLAKR
jgi:hypothetical protein